MKVIIYKTSIIIFYILSIIASIMIILKLTNHSPTVNQVILTLLGIMLVLLIKLQFDTGQLKGEFKHLNKKVDSIGTDLKEHLLKA